MSFVGTDVGPLPATRSERHMVRLNDTRLWIMRDERPARDEDTIGTHPADRLKARNDTKRERDNERKAKTRDRRNGKQRNRR
jgi:hypothetical protein